MSIGLRRWCRSPAVSPQVTEAINLAVGHHHFLPVLRLPPQPPSIIAHWVVPNYTAWWQRHMCINNLPKVHSTEGQLGFEPATCWSQIWPPNHSATEPHTMLISFSAPIKLLISYRHVSIKTVRLKQCWDLNWNIWLAMQLSSRLHNIRNTYNILILQQIPKQRVSRKANIFDFYSTNWLQCLQHYKYQTSVLLTLLTNNNSNVFGEGWYLYWYFLNCKLKVFMIN